ncbi:MAG: AraC family transcriptional regulator ligand-binding domain-containing protein, partial [Parahaliea sp.]
RGMNFFSLISEHIDIHYHVSRRTREFSLHIRTPRGGHTELFVETWMAAWHRLASWTMGRHIPLEMVSFVHPAPRDAHEVLGLFACPCHFSAPGNSFRFSSDYASLTPAQGMLALRDSLATHGTTPFDIPEPDMAYSDLVGQTIRKLSRQWPRDMPAFGSVAEALYITPQTLRRKLQEEGTHFKRLKDALRRDFVREQLRYSRRSVETIAEQAGFSESSSLIRAFKRWTGTTPAMFRRSG